MQQAPGHGVPDHRPSVRDAIRRVAPDIEPDDIDDHVDFRLAAGLDSMDHLNVLAAIAAATGVEVPDAEAAKLSTIAALAAYVEAHVPAR